MEIYENENDQVEAVKRFFAENGKALAVGVILGVGALIGWRYCTLRFSCLSKCGYRSERRQTG